MCSNLAQTPVEKEKAGQQMFARSSHTQTHILFFFFLISFRVWLFFTIRVYINRQKMGGGRRKTGGGVLGGVKIETGSCVLPGWKTAVRSRQTSVVH